jgi:hypothetical protein
MSRTYTSTTKVTLFLFIFLFWLCTEHATGTPPVAVPTSLLGMQHNPCLWGGQAVGFCRVPHCADLAAINHAWVALATPRAITPINFTEMPVLQTLLCSLARHAVAVNAMRLL